MLIRCGVREIIDCEFAHGQLSHAARSLQGMEFLLLWWDDLDDWTHACRHLATFAFSEIAETGYAIAPLLATGFATLSATGAYLLLRLHS